MGYIGDHKTILSDWLLFIIIRVAFLSSSEYWRLLIGPFWFRGSYHVFASLFLILGNPLLLNSVWLSVFAWVILLEFLILLFLCHQLIDFFFVIRFLIFFSSVSYYSIPIDQVLVYLIYIINLIFCTAKFVPSVSILCVSDLSMAKKSLIHSPSRISQFCTSISVSFSFKFWNLNYSL